MKTEINNSSSILNRFFSVNLKEVIKIQYIFVFFFFFLYNVGIQKGDGKAVVLTCTLKFRDIPDII